MVINQPSGLDARFWAIVVAAGKGQRMHADRPKQYLPLAGRTVIEHSLNAFLQLRLIERIVVVIAPQDRHWSSLAISQHPKIITAIGGCTRADSSRQGLRALTPLAHPHDWIVEHDGVRPCLRTDELARFIRQLREHAVGGLAAYPVQDTLKRSNASQGVLNTLTRQHLWHAATPQMFRYHLLSSALTNAKTQTQLITDSAMAIELAGYQPQLIPCAKTNIKLTEVQDLVLARCVLECL